MDIGIFSRLGNRPGISHAQAIQEHLTIARAIAATTARLQIGLSVLQLALDHSLRVAQDVATVDQISQGRLIVGVGRGGRQTSPTTRYLKPRLCSGRLGPWQANCRG